MKNLLLNDAKRYRRMYRNPSETYECAIRSHINELVIPYTHMLTFEIRQAKEQPCLHKADKKWLYDRLKTLIINVQSLESIAIEFFD